MTDSLHHLNSHRPPRRRGLSLVVVMGLLAMTLAVTYALLRTEVNSMQLLGHVDRRDEARQAAYVGLSAALRKMHQSSWEGVTSTVSGSLSTLESYTVTYTTGDSRIIAGSADDAKWAYRVTMTSIGKSIDPTNSSIVSTHTAKAIVELVPRAVASLPSSWSSRIEPYVLMQWGNRNVAVELPTRIRGAAHLQGSLRLVRDYPGNGEAKERYLTHLNWMRLFNMPDNRPFNGPVALTRSRSDSNDESALEDDLGVSVSDTAINGTAPLTHPGTVTSYRLYTGGAIYSATTLPATVQNTTLQADARTNPLGLFVREGWVQIGSNVSIKGTVIASGSSGTLEFTGSNISITPVDLPTLAIDHGSRQMPALIVNDDILIQDTAQASVTGLTFVNDYFRLAKGGNTVSTSFRGRVVTNGIELLGRTSWDDNVLNWGNIVAAYDALGFNAGAFFPTYMQNQYGLDPTPKLLIRDDTNSSAHFWPDWSQAIFLKHASDPGLRWDVLEWVDVN